MLRGGAKGPAARLLLALCLVESWPSRVDAQPPVRSRDIGFATVAYDNGATFGALTLNETALLERQTGSVLANGLLSLFNDGRWSMQGLLSGSRFSSPMVPGGKLQHWFSDLRGELAVSAAATAQVSFMPTFQVNGETRLHLSSENYAVRGGATLARTFDGVGWRTTVIGEAGGWWRVGPAAIARVTTKPMQLQFGDLLGDTEGGFAWVRGNSEYDISLGVRVGEASRRTTGWGSFTATWPLAAGLFGTASIGSYPIDLIQGLPGGRYASFAIRLPGAKWPSLRIGAPKPLPVRRPEHPELPTTEPLALVIGPALDSLEIREIRVWAPGVGEVEVVADFVDWLPAPLIRQPNGEWRGYYYVRQGLHRLNLRLDRRELAVPRNLLTVDDEFTGKVGLLVVR